MEKRRALLRMLAHGGLVLSASAWGTKTRAPVRIGLTPVFLDDQAGFLSRWRRNLEVELDRPVAFLQRGNYREIVDLLRQDKLDFAWLCGYPYVRHRAQMKLLAVPLFQGRPVYQSYLIVNAGDRRSHRLADLRGKIFAFSDPDSNSGFLYPRYALIESNETPTTFFKRTFFTWGHRKVVAAVASGLAQAGAVDGYVWETLARLHPDLTSGTRVIEKSPEFGFPPFVARASIADGEYRDLQRALIGMGGSAEGQVLLGSLNLDGFVAGDAALFDGIAKMVRRVNAA